MNIQKKEKSFLPTISIVRANFVREREKILHPQHK